jgi:hypothetical protein
MFIACGFLLCILIVSVVSMGLAYDGKCGGYFPGLSVRRSCSFWNYLSGDGFVIAMIMAVTFWPVVLVLLVLPPFVGYLLDRRAKRNAA